MFNESGLEAIVPNTPPGRPSSLSEEQKETLKTDVLTHPRELGYEFSWSQYRPQKMNAMALLLYIVDIFANQVLKI